MRLYELIKQCITNIRPIKYGGTGAVTAEEARNNLDVKRYLTRTVKPSSVKISANTYKTVSVATPTVAGYTPIGLIQIENTKFELVLNRYIVPNNIAYVTFRNVSNSAITASPEYTILYESL